MRTLTLTFHTSSLGQRRTGKGNGNCVVTVYASMRRCQPYYNNIIIHSTFMIPAKTMKNKSK